MQLDARFTAVAGRQLGDSERHVAVAFRVLAIDQTVRRAFLGFDGVVTIFQVHGEDHVTESVPAPGFRPEGAPNRPGHVDFLVIPVA